MEYFIHYSLILISIFGKRLKDFQNFSLVSKRNIKKEKPTEENWKSMVFDLPVVCISISKTRWHLFFFFWIQVNFGEYELFIFSPSFSSSSPRKIKMVILWMRTDFAPLTVMECWFFVSGSWAEQKRGGGWEPFKLSFLYACWLPEHRIKFMILFVLGLRDWWEKFKFFRIRG